VDDFGCIKDATTTRTTTTTTTATTTINVQTITFVEPSKLYKPRRVSHYFL